MLPDFIQQFEKQIQKHLAITSLNEMQITAFRESQINEFVTLLANTGSGKTLAFLSVLYQRFREPEFQTQALIITPTRELTIQIEQVAKSLKFPFKITSCYGGHKREIEENELIQAPKLIIGTPGRLCDHIRRGNIHTEAIESIVIDEFDKSLELGYMDEINFILENLSALKYGMFTSATTIETPTELSILKNSKVLDFRKAEMYDWDKIIKRRISITEEDKKEEVLFRLLCEIGENKSTIVFFNFKEDVDKISQFLKEKGIPNSCYHGSMEQYERESSLARFKMGAVNVLLCTDIASRGLDINNLRYVIHYQMPSQESSLIHRNGRTARMDASGTIVAMVKDGSEPEYLQKDEYEVWNHKEFSDELPEKPKWVCFQFPFGKKNKVNKIDIVGFLTQKGQLKKEDIGLIEVKDFTAFAAVRKGPSARALELCKKERIKGKISKVTIVK